MIVRRLSLVLAAAALALAGPVSVPAKPAAGSVESGPVEIGIVAINDFHGNLLPPHQSVVAPDGKGGGYVQVPAGGAAFLASAIDAIRAKYRNTLTVSAGDLISGAPFLASLYLDEPTVGVMNRIGLDYDALGNHEFDRGSAELLRLAHGGCEKHTVNIPCALEPYQGARFQFLAANTLTAKGETLFPPYALKSFGEGRRKVTVGIIGLVTATMPQLTPPAKQEGMTWPDEADTANALVPKLKAAGADVIVVLIHQGGTTSNETPDPNGCTNLHGTPRDDIRPILARFDPRIDVVVSGHTHWAYVCDWPSARDPSHRFLLTSAGLWGKLVTDITLKVDPATHRLVARSAHNVIVQSDGYEGALGLVDNTEAYPRFHARADIAAYLQKYTDAAAAYTGRVVGWLSGPADKTSGHWFNTGGPLGALIADGQLAATRAAGAQIAFMNPFGARASIYPAADGSVTFGQISATQPFQDTLVTQTLTGREIKAVLEQGLDAVGPEQILMPSAGFVYRYDRSRPIGDRITAMALNGEPIGFDRAYRVTTSMFLANGGDTFDAFTKGRDRTPGPTDVAAFEAWLKGAHPRVLPSDTRTIDDRPELNHYDNPAPPGQHY